MTDTRTYDKHLQKPFPEATISAESPTNLILPVLF